MKRFLLFMLIGVSAFCAEAQIFYKIEGKNLKKPSYLFGTHHYAPESMLDSLPAVMQALSETEVVVGELDMTQGQMAMALAMQPHMMAPADSTLSKLVSAEKFAEMDSIFSSLTGGMKLNMFEGMKPVVVDATLAALLAARNLPQTGQLDTFFQNIAKKESKKVEGLETPEFQAHVLFDIIPISKQMETLISTLDDPQEILSATEKLTQAYLSRNAEAIWEIGKEASEESEGEFFEHILDKRNRSWLAQLPEMMENNSLFIAVGALHLFGEQGLIEGLKAEGYKVTPIL